MPPSSARRPLSVAAALAVCSLVGALAGVVGGAGPADAVPGTLTVTTTADGDANGACSDSSVTVTASPVTLRNALCVASNSGAGQWTVAVPAGEYRLTGSDPLTVGTVSGADITVSGTGDPTIVGSGSAQVFLLDPGLTGSVDVTLDGIQVAGGADTLYGGGAVLGGSPDPARPDSLTITDSTFTDNTAAASGGATNAGGGAVQFVGGSLTVSGSTFTGNSSGTSSGGAILYQTVGTTGSTGQSLSISASTFRSNTATATGVTGGAAVAVSDPQSAAALTIADSTFDANTVAGGSGLFHGSAVWLDGGALSVTGSTFTDNENTTGDGSALSVTAGSLSAQYNRIAGNASPALRVLGGAATATRNWWGCAGGPSAAGCDTASGGTTSPYLTLGLSASPAPIVQPGSSSSVTASLLEDSDGAAVSASSLGALSSLRVSWGTDGIAGASVSPASSPLSAGAATTTFTSGATGAATITATFDDGAVALPLGVLSAPAVTTTGPLTGVVGEAESGSGAIAATGYPAPSLSVTGLPAGIGFTDHGDGTGVLTGTPTGPAADYTLTVSATNSVTSTQKQLTYRLDEVPALTSPAAETVTVGTAADVAITASGRPTPTPIALTGTLPAGLAFRDAGDGSAHIAGTPAAGTGGVYSLMLTASNGIGAPATQSLTLTVDEAPAFTSSSQSAATMGAPFDFEVATAHAYPVPALSVTDLPAGLSFTDRGDGTGAITGTPTGPGETVDVSLSATNGVGGPVGATLSLEIRQAPVITLAPVDQQVTAGGNAAFTATASGYPAPSIQWAVSTDRGATYHDLPGETGGTLTVAAAVGNDGNRYRVTFTNTAGSVSAAASLSVGTTPAFTSAAGAAFSVGSPGSTTVAASGFPSAAITAGPGLPAWLTLVDHGDGTATLTGTPPAASGGVYPFTLTAANGYQPDATQPFVLTVAQSPVITSASAAAFTADASGSFTVTATPGFPVATTFSESGALPAGVRFVDGGAGSAALVGTPEPGTGGVYPISLTATNGTAADAVQSFTLTVAEAATFTSPDTFDITRGVAADARILTSHAYPAVTGIALAGPLPAGLTFTDNGDGTASIAGTTTDAAGTVTLAVTATAPGGAAAAQTLTVALSDAPTVALPLLPPLADGTVGGVPGSVAPGQSLTLMAAGFAPASPVTFGIYSSPVALAVVDADASGTATARIVIPAGYTGAHSIVAVGTAPDGTVRSLRTDVTLPGGSQADGEGGSGSGGGTTEAVSGSGSAGTAADLAGTGSDLLPWLLLGAGLLGAGIAVVLRRRTRRV